MDDLTKDEKTPFHRGELQLQDRLGVREQVHTYAPRFIRDHMPREHRAFFAQLPQLIVGSIDDKGRPWASMLAGRPVFMSSPDPSHLNIATRPLYGDPLNDTLALSTPLGFLGIEFHTRRRNRFTGKVSQLDDSGIQVAIDQSFGNCPQYIQARGFEVTDTIDTPEVERPITNNTKLDTKSRAMIESADTFFIASVFFEDSKDKSHGVDVSHRGGRPGFVEVVDEQTLLFPDFRGNFHFNTLGNIALNPKAGLLFPDFETGDMLYITGSAEILWDGEELEAFEGAERLVRIKIDEIIRVENSLTLRWNFKGYAPDLVRTGIWQEVAESIDVNHDRDSWRRFTVGHIEKESEVISSFYLTPVDGKPLASYKPGQFLPIRLDIPGEKDLVQRTYTVSESPNGKFYRLSIKREDHGVVSRYFHDDIKPGSTFEVMAPRGKFILDEESKRPVVFLSAGVGITPMISMLDHMLVESAKNNSHRDIHFIHGAVNGQSHAFGRHVRLLESQIESLNVHIRYSNPGQDDQQGRSHEDVGHIDVALLQSLLPLDDYDFYLCGPPGFMQALYEGLSLLGVVEDRIHYESFGPAMVLKLSEKARKFNIVDAPAKGPVQVCFAKSGIEVEWQPDKGTLLDLALDQGLTPAFSCRGGLCGTCATKVKSGDVNYLDEPIAQHEDDEVLICCSTPRCHKDDETCGDEFGVILDL